MSDVTKAVDEIRERQKFLVGSVTTDVTIKIYAHIQIMNT